jgi:NAD(P)-dependent dehydrogenase (short-subunit alcohol dehydrogenase family)
VEGRVALVTGGGSTPGAPGIGAPIALRLAREGAIVRVLDLDAARAGHTAAEIAVRGGAGSAAVCDVRSPAACELAVGDAVRELGGIAILVNNVGVAGGSRLEALDVDEWEDIYAINVRGAALMTKEVLPSMTDRGGGAIVNIASIAALQAGSSPIYRSSKAALVALTQSTAVAYGRRGIRANVVAPGHLYTPMVSGRLSEAEREARRLIAPLGIEGTAEDVAGGVTVVGPLTARSWLP